MTYLIAAWDQVDLKRERLRMYSAGDGTATFTTEKAVPLADHEEMVEQLVSQGYRIGSVVRDYVWVIDDRGFVLFADGSLVASSEQPPADVTAVHVYVESVKHRGIRLELRRGEPRVLVEQHDDTPDLDPTYGDTELKDDTRWARFLGKHLALWIDAPLVDDTARLKADADLAMMRAARRLAGRLTGGGSPPELRESAGAVGRASEVALHVMTSGSTASLDLQVTSTKGTTRATPVIKRGSPSQVSAFLHRVSTPSTLLFAMNEVIDQLKRSGLA